MKRLYTILLVALTLSACGKKQEITATIANNSCQPTDGIDVYETVFNNKDLLASNKYKVIFNGEVLRDDCATNIAAPPPTNALLVEFSFPQAGQLQTVINEDAIDTNAIANRIRSFRIEMTPGCIAAPVVIFDEMISYGLPARGEACDSNSYYSNDISF